MPDTKISALTALTGSTVSTSVDVLPIVSTSATTTRKLTVQSLLDSVQGIPTITSANVSQADSLMLYSVSTAASRILTVSNLGASITASNVPSGTTQGQQETATVTNAYVSPGVQHFHPGHPKAWGMITAPTTVTLSYPSTGVSVVKNSTGNYTITHGKTFSSTSYIGLLCSDDGDGAIGRIVSRTATALTVQFRNTSTANVVDPTIFYYALYGDT